MKWAFVFFAWAAALAPASAADLRVRGKLQARVDLIDQSTLDRDADGWTHYLDIPRARLDLRWDPSKRLRLVLELDAADGFAAAGNGGNGGFAVDQLLKDAYGEFRLGRKLFLRAGHFKKPLSRLRLTSPWDLLVPERGMMDSTFIGGLHLGDLAGSGAAQHAGGYGDRDLGIMAGGRVKSWLDLRWSLGYFNALDFLSGRESSHRDVVARLELRPARWLSLAVNGCAKRFSVAASRQDFWVAMVGADAEIEAGGFAARLEAGFGDNPVLYNPAEPGQADFHLGGGKFIGGHLTLSYRIELGSSLWLTPAVMGEVLEPTTAVSGEGYRVAGGLNLDFGDGARLALYFETTLGDPRSVAYADHSVAPIEEPLYFPTRAGLQLNLVF